MKWQNIIQKILGYSTVCKSAVVERIERVMKYKKRYFSIFAAILIIACSVLVFLLLEIHPI